MQVVRREDTRVPQRLWVQLGGRRCWGLCVPLAVDRHRRWELRVWSPCAAYYSVFDESPWEVIENLLPEWQQVCFLDTDEGWNDRCSS